MHPRCPLPPVLLTVSSSLLPSAPDKPTSRMVEYAALTRLCFRACFMRDGVCFWRGLHQPYLERIQRMQSLYGISTVFIATQDARILLAAQVWACC